MAGVHIPPDYALIQFKGKNQQGHLCIAEIGASTTGIPTQSNIDALSTAVGAKVTALVAGGQSYEGCTVTIGLPSGLLQRFESTTGAAGGVPTGTVCPPQVQFLIKKITGFVGRQYRGRQYWWGPRESAVDDTGTVQVADVTNLTNLANQQMTSLAAAPWGGAVLLHSNPALAPTPILNLLASNRVASQRRRYKR